MSKNYILHSTQESRDNGTTSLLAIVETIFFVALTWGIAYYYDTYTHIYIAIAIAPFLLLKTPISTQKAIEWFLYKHEIDKKKYYKDKFFWIIFIISYLLSFIVSYFFSTKVLIHYEGWELLFLSMILGILLVLVVGGVVIGVVGVGIVVGGVAVGAIVVGVVVLVIVEGVVGVVVEEVLGGVGVVIGAEIGVVVLVLVVLLLLDEIKNKILKKFIFLLFSPFWLFLGAGFGLSLFIKSIFIKFITTAFYTFTYPKKTFFNISKNWNEQITINDIFYTPELLPNIHKKDNFYQLSSFISSFINKNLEWKLFLLLVIPIWSLGYLYRFSIKSTAWFFFPLAYLTNLNALEDEMKKNKAIKIQTWKSLFRFNIMISAVLFFYFQFKRQYLELLGLSKELLSFIQDKMTLLGQYLIPKAMYLLVVAVALYFVLTLFISLKEHIKDDNFSILTYWLIKLIFVLWMIFLAWHLVILTNQYVLPKLPKIFGM